MPKEIQYHCTEDEDRLAYTLAYVRRSLNRGGSNCARETASKNEKLTQDYNAILAEIAVARVFNLCWTGCGKGSYGGKDVGGLLEVRSVIRRDRGLLANTKENEDSPAVMVLVENRLCTLLGWSFFGTIKAFGKVHNKDTPKPFWILPISEMSELSLLSEWVEDHRVDVRREELLLAE